MKVKIKSREEIEKTLDEYGDHKEKKECFFRLGMFGLCGLILEAGKSPDPDFSCLTKHIYSHGLEYWFWHPDWYEVVEPDFTEEDLLLIDFMSETLEHFMEQK